MTLAWKNNENKLRLFDRVIFVRHHFVLKIRQRVCVWPQWSEWSGFLKRNYGLRGRYNWREREEKKEKKRK